VSIQLKRNLDVLLNGLGRQPTSGEYVVLLSALTFNLLDSFTTLSFTLTGTGSEVNPALRHLIGVNTFLVYPFLLSTLLPVLLFRFNSIVEYGLAFLNVAVNLAASLNNFGVIFSYKQLILPFLGVIGAQFAAFVAGLFFIALLTLYSCLKENCFFIDTIKKLSLNYTFYLFAYLITSLIPAVWLIMFP
jgi:hypothetical protein